MKRQRNAIIRRGEKRREEPYPKTEPMRAPAAESVAKRRRQTAGAAGTRALGELE